jgi:hypothetical protein
VSIYTKALGVNDLESSIEARDIPPGAKTGDFPALSTVYFIYQKPPLRGLSHDRAI